MTAVWEQHELSQSETLVALALADHANDQGLCWPSIDRIAKKARLSSRQVKRILQDLEAKGLLVVNRKHGRNQTNQYRLSIKGDMASPFSGKGDMERQEKVTSGARKGDTAMSPKSPLTIKESSEDWSIDIDFKEKTNTKLASEVLGRLRAKTRGRC